MLSHEPSRQDGPDIGANAPGAGTGSLIGELLRNARVHFGMHTAFVSEFRDDQRVFRYVDSALENPAVVAGQGGPLEDSYCARVVDGRLPNLIPDARRNAEAAGLPVTAELPVGAHVSVPITFSDGRIFGTFCAFDARPDATLQPRDLAVLRMLADRVARFLESEAGNERDRRSAADEVARDLEPGAIKPHFQPIVQLRDLAVVGYEALARFGVAPHEPFPHFETARRAGMGVDLELAALRAICPDLAGLPADTYLAVNVSPSALLDPRIEDALKHAGIERLVVELTEHFAVADYSRLVTVASRLQAAGIRIAVDDAGAGFSSLSHILKLRPDIIKLDQSLVQGVAGDPVRRALAQALVSFAARVEADLVAEGIENDADLAELRKLGVRYGQGYVFGRPSRWYGTPER